MKKEPKERIAESIKHNESGCWIWQGYQRGKAKDGFYGGIKVGARSWLAHRYSYTVFKGEIPVGMSVCHSCDNPLCVNPDHLFLGTHEDNMRDMANKQRGTSGRGVFRKLTEDSVLKIRSLKGQLLHREIAKQFGISTTGVTLIINRKYWKHI